MIEKFVALGERLRGFGGDDTSRDVMRRAVEQNPWFTEEDILGLPKGTAIARLLKKLRWL